MALDLKKSIYHFELRPTIYYYRKEYNFRETKFNFKKRPSLLNDYLMRKIYYVMIILQPNLHISVAGYGGVGLSFFILFYSFNFISY